MQKSSLFLIALIVILVSCSKKSEEYQVKKESITESVYASGIIKSKNQYQVFSKANGLIEIIFVLEGDSVKKGDAILRLTNASSKLNTENAKLAFELANENTRGEKLKQLEVEIGLAKNKYLNDSLLWLRQTTLWEQKIGTQVELEQRELAFKTSKSNYKNSILRYDDAKKTLQFQSSQAQNNVRISQLIEDDFILRSETNGRLFTWLKEKGEMVTAMSPVAIIGDDSEFLIELQVDEYDITRLMKGQEVVLHLDSYKGQLFKGKIIRINSIMNERSRSFTVEAVFIQAPKTLYPNLTVEANIVIQTKENAITVPRNFLIGDSMVINNKKKKILVKVGLKDYKKAEIIEGLNVGDILIKPE